MNNPLVVGYKGEIGSFILNGLLRVMPKALNIWCVDVNETLSEVVERINKSDVIFLCVPFNETLNWLNKYQLVLQGKVVVEQCSLKEELYKQAPKGIILKSMHILYRPSQTPNLDDRMVGLVEGDFDAVFEEQIGNITQSHIVWFDSIAQHDKQMAIQQALIHRVLLLLGEQLASCHGTTYISKKVIDLTNRIKSGNLHLYKAIQDNEHLNEHLETFKKKLTDFNIENYMDKR